MADLQQLENALRSELRLRHEFKRDVIFQAAPEMKYGAFVEVLDIVAKAGGSSHLMIEGSAESVFVEMFEMPLPIKNIAVDVPSVVSYIWIPGYAKNALMVTIPQPGVYLIGEKKILSTDENYEQMLGAQVRAAMRLVGPAEPHALYLNCDKEVPYSHLEPLIKAAQPHIAELALWVKGGTKMRLMGIERGKPDVNPTRKKRKPQKE
jgi:biopolymer transport protein ExbD